MYELRWTTQAVRDYEELKNAATTVGRSGKKGTRKSSRQEGTWRQVCKTLERLRTNPRHPGLCTHPYDSLPHPFDAKAKVFEAYAQNNTPGAYRVFWCYGPKPGQMTIIAITAHP